MPPQTRAAARRVVAPTSLDVLPQPLALRILSSLSADARLLAAAVCRSWRAMLADPALWTRLDLSPASGVANPMSDALLRAAAARAGGQLEVLRVYLQQQQPHDELLAVLASNAGTLRELALFTEDADEPPTAGTVAELLRAAPGLRVLETGVDCEGAVALRVLRKEPPFGPLRLKRIMLQHTAAIGWPAVAEGLAAHTLVEDICLIDDWPQSQADSDALVGALLSLPQLRSLYLTRPPASVVARLLRCPALKSLGVYDHDDVPLLDTPASAAVLCDALRANTQIETLHFVIAVLWHDMGAATALLATLQTHQSLKELDIRFNSALRERAAAAGAALGALIAHSPALEVLSIFGCQLRDAGLGPFMDALPHARHLLKLNCIRNSMSEAFARKRLLPAVRACLSLRTLGAYGSPALREAQLLLQQRR